MDFVMKISSRPIYTRSYHCDIIYLIYRIIWIVGIDENPIK